MRPRTISVIVGLLVCLQVPDSRPCSIFMATDGQRVLAGNNEDWQGGDFDTAIWFVPPEDGNYGFMVVGYSEFEGQTVYSPQGGMNDQGLFIDINAVPYLEAEINGEGEIPTAWGLFGKLLGQCATVDEAIDVLSTFYLSGVIERCKLVLADSLGNGAIVEGDWITRREGAYLISTNFYESHPELGGWPCWRYNTIEQMMSTGLELTVDFFVQAAEAAHQGDTPDAPVLTWYTNVCDLNSLEIHLYYLLDYQNPVVFDLAEELSLGGGFCKMADLFGPEFQEQRAVIELHPESIHPPGRLAVLVYDAGPNLDPAVRDSLEVTLTSDFEPEGEAFGLTEIGPDRGIFAGSLPVRIGPEANSDGVLRVSLGGIITATYWDEDDGSGNPNALVERAVVSCDRDMDGAQDVGCGGTDCNDLRIGVRPGALEFCDGEDDDCDGTVDEDCIACKVAVEPDIDAPTMLACGQCADGDFDEEHYSDSGFYRVWGDVYQIEGVAGEAFMTHVHRPLGNGVLGQTLVDESLNVLETDLGMDKVPGYLFYQFEQDGVYYLLITLMRVDQVMEPNTYHLEMYCPEDLQPDGGTEEPDGGNGDDGGVEPDGSAPDGTANDAAGDTTDAGSGNGSSGCGCRVVYGPVRDGARPAGGLITLAGLGMLIGFLRRRKIR